MKCNRSRYAGKQHRAATPTVTDSTALFIPLYGAKFPKTVRDVLGCHLLPGTTASIIHSVLLQQYVLELFASLMLWHPVYNVCNTTHISAFWLKNMWSGHTRLVTGRHCSRCVHYCITLTRHSTSAARQFHACTRYIEPGPNILHHLWAMPGVKRTAAS